MSISNRPSMHNSETKGIRILPLVTLVFVLLLQGCFFGHPPVAAGVRNLTGQPIEVYYIGAEEDGGDTFMFELETTRVVSIPNEIAVDCTTHPLQARTLDGEIIDRYTDMLCSGDVWEVDSTP